MSQSTLVTSFFCISSLFCANHALAKVSAVSPTLQADSSSDFSTASTLDEEQSVERIVVSSDLLLRELVDLPASAIVLSQDQIDKRQARHIEDLVSVAPNLNFASGASRGRFIQIRGIGERSQFAEPINPSIGILLDDIDISGIGGLASVYDLQQLEVLSGPQTIASGVNSIGGAIKLVSAQASDEQYLKLNASFAQFNERQIGATYSNNVNEQLKARFAVQQTTSDGFVKNAFLSRDDTNNIDETTAKALFNFRFNEQSQVDLNLYYFDIGNGYDAFSLDNDNVTQSDNPGFDTVDASAASLKFSHFFSQYKLEAIAFGLNADTAYGYDEDWTHVGFHPFEYASVDSYQRDISRQGIDVKLANVEAINPFLVGINYRSTDEDLVRQNTFLDEDYLSRYQPESLSVYGQYSLAINDNINLTGALRYEDFSASFNDNSGQTLVDDGLFAASLAIDYSIEDTLLFANISRGYKAAGFNIDSRLPNDSRAYEAETNYSYELGVKGEALEGMANINLTFFYMARKDAQIDDSIVVSIDDSGASSFIDGIGNADTGINKGIELSSSFDLSDNWLVQANLGYLDASFGNYTKLDGDFVPSQEQAHAPKRTAYLSSTWDITEQFSWFVDLEYKDDFRLGVNHDERSDSTAIFNTELSWTSTGEHQYSLSFWIKNISDEEVITRGFGSFPNDPRDSYSTFGPYYQLGQERQIGISLQYEWY